MSTRPTIGVLSPFVGGFYYGGLIYGISQAAAEAGVRLLAIQTDQITDPASFEALQHHYAGWEQLSGCILLNEAVTSTYRDVVLASGRPLVLISSELAGASCPIVQPDNRSGMRDAVRHLIWHGHRRIAFAGMLDQDDFRERYEAYVEALTEAGIEPDPTLLYSTPSNTEADSLDLEQGRAVGRQMLAEGMRSTAIVGGDDEHAIGIIQVLTEAGLSLPRDQAVVGFDDIEGAAYSTPRLSSVRQDFGALGRLAATLLLDQLAGKRVAPGRYEVPTSFVIRGSCGCTETVTETLPASAISNTAEVRQHNLSQRLSHTLRHNGDLASRAETVASAASIIASSMEEAIADASSVPNGLISATAAALYESDPRGDTVQGVIQAVHQHILELLASHTKATPATVARLAAREVSVMLGLTEARSHDQFGETNYLQGALSSQYDVAVDLLRSDKEDPRSLRWLKRTAVRGAHLALWPESSGTALAGDPIIHVVGKFERDLADQDTTARSTVDSIRASAFPSEELLALTDDHPGEIIMLLPVRLNSTDWGLLGAVGPVERKVASGREGINQWATLLSVALEHQAGVASLERAYAREQALVEDVKASGERYALATEAASGGLWDWDVVRNTVYYSPRWKAMLDCSDDSVGNSTEEWFGRVHPDDLANLRAAIESHVLRRDKDLEIEHRIRRRDGTYRWVLCRAIAVRGANGDPVRMVGSLTDVHDRRRLEEQLRHDALYDSLTALPNRTLFIDRLRLAIGRAQREEGYKFAVLFLDIDDFKLVNDSLGHLLGDALLSIVAERISTDLRPSDTAARFGGDEFAILLDDVGATSNSAAVAKRLQERLALPFLVNGHEIVVTASIGIATSSATHQIAEDVLRDADTAMYRAKNDGKGTHATFDASMHTRAVNRLQIETELRQAVDADQLRLHYQPIVAINTSKAAGFEALVRWEHPTRGLLGPDKFLSIAEETGLIVPMGRWIMAESCRQLAQWRTAGLAEGLRISVNFSNRQFWHGGLLKDLQSYLRDANLEPRDIVLEITETVVMDNADLAERMLAELHDSGFALHIDDFGTGYSSLQALHRFPIEALKVDRSFVWGLGVEPRSTELIRTIAMMARNLGVDVIAEGIETIDQRDRVEALGCGYGQGYLYSKPVPGDIAAKFLIGDTADKAADGSSRSLPQRAAS